MFKIKQFAQIAQIPMSTLRYYDEIGLFRPFQVDPATGYRFYSVEQLLELNRILALRDLGLEITQIGQLLEQGISLEALHGMLQLRQAKLQQLIQAEQEQLAQVQARLRYLELAGDKLAYQVVLKEVKAFKVLASRTQVIGFGPNERYTKTLLEMLRQNGIKPEGHLLYVYHKGLATQDFEVELAVPIEEVSPDKLKLKLDANWRERITFGELPEVTNMASTIYHGSPYAIVEAYQALGKWIALSGYKIVGPCRKVRLRWSGELDDYLTEVQYPVERVANLATQSQSH
jgi:DNA-binding transcriptional MerR regulator